MITCFLNNVINRWKFNCWRMNADIGQCFSCVWYYILCKLTSVTYTTETHTQSRTDINRHKHIRIFLNYNLIMYVTGFSLHYRHFHGNYSDEFHFLVPGILTFTGKTWYAHCNEPPFFPSYPTCDVYVPRTATLGNRFPRDCFHDHYNINFFKYRINRYFRDISE